MHLIHKLYIKLIKNFNLIKIKYLFIIFLLSPFLIFIVLIKPIVLIRFGNLGCERIGRFFDNEQGTRGLSLEWKTLFGILNRVFDGEKDDQR